MLLQMKLKISRFRLQLQLNIKFNQKKTQRNDKCTQGYLHLCKHALPSACQHHVPSTQELFPYTACPYIYRKRIPDLGESSVRCVCMCMHVYVCVFIQKKNYKKKDLLGGSGYSPKIGEIYWERNWQGGFQNVILKMCPTPEPLHPIVWPLPQKSKFSRATLALLLIDQKG